MECRVKPYDGAEARTAIIHVSDDDAVAFPFIERLSKSGLRVWHDSDIRKVMVEYKRNWKKQQASCSSYLVFLTSSAVNSHVFRERLTNAVESHKPFIVINSLGQNTLSQGMRLQIEKAENVIQSSYIPKEKLAEEIVGLPVLKDCVGKADPGMEVSHYPNEHIEQRKSVPVSPERNIAPSDRTMLELHGTQIAAEHVQDTASEKKDPVLTGQKSSEPQDSTPDNSVSLEDTIPISDSNSPTAVYSDETYVPQKVELPIIISLMSGEKRKGILGESVVGRTKKIQGTVADISFTDENRLFSGKHFSLIYIDNMCMIICKHPNGMNINGQEMQEGDKFTVESEAIIQIPSNATLAQAEKKEVYSTYLMVATGNRAKEFWNAEAIAFLKSRETGEIRYFTDQFSFGRGNAWKTGVMVSRTIGRNHGSIIMNSGRFFFQDHSTNGTMINGTKINNDSLELNNGDIISVQGVEQSKESFEFHSCFIERG